MGQPHAVGMARMLAQEWARRTEPTVVLAWTDGLADDSERRDATTWVFQDWRLRDEAAAMQWLQVREPMEPMFRPVLAAHMRRLLTQDPALAIAWVGGIVDLSRRRDAERALARVWLERDAEAATEWIRDAGIEGIDERGEPRSKAREGGAESERTLER